MNGLDPGGRRPHRTEDVELYRTVLDRVTDVVLLVTPAGTVLWVSPSVESALGISAAEMIGTGLIARIHPDDRERISNALTAEWHDTDAHDLTLRIRHSAGHYLWFTAAGAPSDDVPVSPPGLVVSLRQAEDIVRSRAELAASDERHRHAAEQLRATIDSLLDPCIVMAPIRDAEGAIIDFRYTDVNEAACQYNDLPREKLVGSLLTHWFPGQRQAGLISLYGTALTDGQPVIMDDTPYENERLGPRFYDVRVAPAGDSIVLSWRDVTQRHERQRQLTEQEESFRLIADEMWDAIVRFDAAGMVTWVSPSFERLSGWTADDVVGTDGHQLVEPADLPEVLAALRHLPTGRPDPTLWRLRRADGTTRWIRSLAAPFAPDAGPDRGYYSLLRDVQDETEARLLLQEATGRDPLTGLDTWPVTVAHLEAALAGPPARVALLCIGVDRVKQVNEGMSYASGDALIAAVANRIVRATGGRVPVGRVAGDEFSVVALATRSDAECIEIAETVLRGVRGELTVGFNRIMPTVSIGIATADNFSTPDSLLTAASLAMHAVKADGRDGWRFSDASLAAEAAERLWVESELRMAVDAAQIVPWFQPIVHLPTSQPAGAEALARWLRDGRQVATPDQFLPVAEHCGIVAGLDLLMLHKVLVAATAAEAQQTVAVNISSGTLTSRAFPQRVRELFRESGVDPRSIHFEITETTLLSVSSTIVAAMRDLTQFGIKWYVDDFGTGFSSLSHLRDLPVHGLKLDRTFTAQLFSDDSQAARLARGLVGLAHGLGLDTIAEGIETKEQAELLADQGWAKGQGFLFGAARAPDAVAATHN